MKTSKEIEIALRVTTRRDFTARKTVVSRALAAVAIPAITAGNGPGTVPKEDSNAIRFGPTARN